MNIRKILLSLIPLLFFIVLLYLFWVGLHSDPQFVPSNFIGRKAPDFQIENMLNPDDQLTNKDFKGKVTLFNVWASWCNTCIIEHEMLMQLSKRNNIQLFGLNYKDDYGQALEFIKLRGNPYLKVGYDRKGKVAMNWGVYGSPETFIIDKEGIVRYRHVGPVTDTAIETTLDPIIKKYQAML